ncbi:hypothetical protein Tco_0377447 [Tanacetum coccineum]
MPIEIELTLEQTQQGVSYEVSIVSIVDSKFGRDDSNSLIHSYRAVDPYGIRRWMWKVPDSSDHKISEPTCYTPTDIPLRRHEAQYMLRFRYSLIPYVFLEGTKY